MRPALPRLLWLAPPAAPHSRCSCGCATTQIRDIGSGNFGVAKLCRARDTGELVAVKYIERGEKVGHAGRLACHQQTHSQLLCVASLLGCWQPGDAVDAGVRTSLCGISQQLPLRAACRCRR